MLQRLQERNQLVLLRSAEVTVIVDNSRRFATVVQDGIVAGERQQIMHQPVASA